jgi:hypothetical protein
MATSVSYNTNEIKRTYYLNLFSSNAEVKTNNSKSSEFTWQIRNLDLVTIAEIALVQIAANNASATTTYCIRCNNCYADGFDSYNATSAVLYLGNGLKSPDNPTYHKLISNNINYITLLITDDITSNSGIYNGIDPNITFRFILEITDFIDSQQKF